jgi:hypothetical protein
MNLKKAGSRVIGYLGNKERPGMEEEERNSGKIEMEIFSTQNFWNLGNPRASKLNWDRISKEW